MKLLGMDRPPTRDELPKRLIPSIRVPITDKGTEELERLGARPQRLVPLPAKVNPATTKLRCLAQYKGRSPEGNLRSLANLKRTTASPMSNLPVKAPQIPANIPVPNVPTAIPTVPHGDLMKGKSLRAVLSREEFDLYVETWVEWFKCHGQSFDKVEDLLDVEHVCMETVLQYRTRAQMLAFPNRDYSQPYNQSFLRQQKARENLEARRTDRIKSRSPSGNTTVHVHGGGNVAVMAGSVAMADREQRALAEKQATMDFLAGTEATALTIASEEVFDAEVVPQKENGNA
jgi:hypothetical protein